MAQAMKLPGRYKPDKTHTRRKYVCSKCGAEYSSPGGKAIHSHKNGPWRIRYFA